MSALVVQNLKKSYGTDVAVADVSLTVNAGQIYGLLGPNGAGKTTTLRCIATLAKPDTGSITVFGSSDAREIRQKLGYIAQEVALDKVLTGRELLEFQAALYHMPKPKINSRINEVIELLQLQDHADKLTGTYSGGLKKRLDLAAGLLHQPQMLILDEPTVGLDIQTRAVIWNFLRQLKADGITILITSHYLEEIDALAEGVAIIDKGKVIAEGTPNALKAQLGGDRLTIKIKEFAEYQEASIALNQLKELDFVTTSLINHTQGNAINLVITPNPNAIAQIQTTLADANIPIFSLSQSKPSLDDVFLAATGQTILDAEISQMAAPTKKTTKKLR